MNIFKLPDLGEGLPDAEIHEWFVKVGDTVKADQPLVAMETAKAVVDVPCPQSGVISQLYGKPGDMIKTGDPLVAFAAEEMKSADKGTVVGHLEESNDLSEDHFTIGLQNNTSRIKATAAVKMLAKKLGVDLKTVHATGEHGVITQHDVKAQAEKNAKPPVGFEPLKGVRRAMLHSMVHSHTEVVPVSIFDEVDIHAWPEGTDITARLIRAIVEACKAEPALNAWFNTQHSARQCFEAVHLGIAMDTEEGLFVPVIHDAGKHSLHELRLVINEFKQSVHDRSIAADKLKGATITLSNFGKFSGRFASPIIVPPTVCIVAVGKLYQAVVHSNGSIEAHNTLPLSLSFDHRAVTGGEATRFLGKMIESLKQEK
ncbi:MAG: branched-chain alpha-keto acid dehydrogenase subunit E2 [Legionella sp.]|nr:MAG: branched-chain alpha-keto acid dehydrogenase subunit E2 [Legionella sp.]PJD98984.1 MAG: branched-chain alpha-keto acid dehydrogenase subunit E2 [Legionella sp.]